MRAIVITQPGGPEVLEIREVPDPIPGPEDLLVRIRATALNNGDLLQRRGRHYQGSRPETAGFEIPGIEFAGEVLYAGERTQGFVPGDRVMGLLVGGGYAEMVTIHHRLAMHVPDRLSWSEAGATPEAFITAHDAFRQVDFLAGETTLIHAAGSGVGVAAVQIARVMGASFIGATAGSDEKLARARDLGAHFTINYRETPDFPALVREELGRGVDVVFDLVGADYWARNFQVLERKGRLAVVGILGGTDTKIDLAALVLKRLRVFGTVLRSRPLEEKSAATKAFERGALPHIANGAISVIVDRVFPLEAAGDAQRYLETRANFGKVVLEVG